MVEGGHHLRKAPNPHALKESEVRGNTKQGMGRKIIILYPDNKHPRIKTDIDKISCYFITGYTVALPITMTTYNVATFHSMKHQNPDVWISWRQHDK